MPLTCTDGDELVSNFASPRSKSRDVRPGQTVTSLFRIVPGQDIPNPNTPTDPAEVQGRELVSVILLKSIIGNAARECACPRRGLRLPAAWHRIGGPSCDFPVIRALFVLVSGSSFDGHSRGVRW